MSVELRSRYLGLELRSPLVASAAPHNAEPDVAERLERAGVGAIVLPSLFEEEIVAEDLGLTRALEQGTEYFAEALDYFPALDSFVTTADRYVAALAKVRASVEVPVIASLNATTVGGWVRYARQLQDAGASALELNLYHVAADPRRSGADLEAADLELIAAVRAVLDIPLAVKLSPYYSSLAAFAAECVRAGANGLVLFNRFYAPDIDPETRDIVPRLALSHSAELRLPLRWMAVLRPQLGPDVSLAASSGIHTGIDALKVLLAGADVAMMTSALLLNGPEHVASVEAELRAWLVEHEYESVAQLRGSVSAANTADPSAYERGNYALTLRSWVTPPELTPGAPKPAGFPVSSRGADG
ncbi:MAG TPA: dihydroorotate dehydrogenase-like protein [Candidatus Limnocylindria bacterium]|nr:dihydroorotate dehydrogenase-like protein [Candidatus Limnocylindria bacterium]